MKKRKLHQGNSFINNNNYSSLSVLSTDYGKQRGKRPAARDGHTGIIFGNYYVIFGGDRHHMPFNDTFILDLKAEVTSKSFLFNQ